jgi:hypothetical protein
VRWLVDASNVLGSRPDGWWRDRPAAVARLVDEVAASPLAGSGVGVCDGRADPRLAGRADVDVRWAGSSRRDAADDLIVSLVEAHDDPASLVVATSDRALRSRVQALGASVEGARAFLDRLAPP